MSLALQRRSQGYFPCRAAAADGTAATAPATLALTINNGQSGNSGNNYTYNWTGLQGGTYVLSAVATDNNGATVNAGSIGVIVNSPLPSA